MNSSSAIAKLLERSGMTKSRLSAESGVSRSLIDDYLKGRRQPSMAQLERLGKAANQQLVIAWEPEDVRTPRWARPNPQMAPRPLTVRERGEVLARVVDMAMELRRVPRGDLEFPPFRTLQRTGAS